MIFKKNKQLTEVEKIDYEVYIKHREYLINEKHKVIENEQKLLILLSTGVFSLFFAFARIEQNYNYISIIILSQFSSIISLIVILGSFMLARKSFERAIDIQDSEYLSKEYGPEKNKYLKYVKICLWISRITLIVGLILGFIFYSFNMSEKQNSNMIICMENPEPCIKTNEPSPKPLPITRDK